MPVALVIALAMMQSVIMRSDVDVRAEAVIDPLTGMLNRKALHVRVEELRQQSAITGEPVGLIVADLDHFKAINDTLRARRRRRRPQGRRLRAAQGAARLRPRLPDRRRGVPGAAPRRRAASDTARLAEELRAAVARRTMGDGHEVTMSFGVSATQPGSAWEYEPLFATADAELYRAKAEGRDRVCGAALSSRPRF